MPSLRTVAASVAVSIGLVAPPPSMHARADETRYHVGLGGQAAIQPGGVLAQVSVTWTCPVDTDSEHYYYVEVTLGQSAAEHVVTFATDMDSFSCNGKRHGRQPLLLPIESAVLRPGQAFLRARLRVYAEGEGDAVLATADRVVHVYPVAPASDPDIAPTAQLRAAGIAITGSVRSRCVSVVLLQRLPDGTVQVGDSSVQNPADCGRWADLTWIAPSRAWSRGPATVVLPSVRPRFATIRVR